MTPYTKYITTKITYPTSLNQITKGDNHLYKSNYNNYFIYTSKKSTIDNNDSTSEYYRLFFQLIIYKDNNLQDITFNFNGNTYTNTTNITGYNQFLKSSDPVEILNSIKAMFSLNKVDQEFDIIIHNYNFENYNYLSPLGYTYKSIRFELIGKKGGNFRNITSNMIPIVYSDMPNFQHYYSDLIYDYQGNITNKSIVTLSYFFVVGNNVSEDVEKYELGLDVFKLKGEKSFGNVIYNLEDYEYITSISKKGFNIGDFNLSTLLTNSIKDYYPIINDFNINNIKYLDKFKIVPYQKFIDKSIDVNNLFTNKLLSNQSDSFYVLDAYDSLFKDYVVPNILTPNQIAQINLESINEGTYGLNNINIYDKNLTNQPTFKILNKSYEILCNTMYNNLQIPNSVLSDQVYFKFYYTGTNVTETIILNNTNLHSNESSFRYINQLCFNVKSLKNKIVGDYNNVYKIEVNFFNPIYRNNIPVKYQTQTYLIDQTIQDCNDILSDFDYQPIVFKNSSGGFDLFEFEPTQEIKTNRNIDTFNNSYNFNSTEISEFEKIFNIDYIKSYQIKSRILSDEEFIWLEEIIKSNKVYYLDLNNNKLYPIIITDSDYSFKINTDKQFSFTFKFSKPTQTN